MHITNFVNALRYALDLLGYSSIYLKVKQIRVLEALYHQKDVVAVLPTGYGKSVILHILPFLLEYKEQDKHSRKNAVMVIAPLNSLIDDQVGHLRKKGINVSILCSSGANKIHNSGRQLWASDSDTNSEEESVKNYEHGDRHGLQDSYDDRRILFTHLENVVLKNLLLSNRGLCS